MKVLGISGIPLSFPFENIYNLPPNHFHDSAAVLVDESKVVAGIEEERLNRIKHTNKAPISAIRFCLENSGVDLDEIDQVALSCQENSLNGFLQGHFVSKFKDQKDFLGARNYVHRMIKQSLGRDIDDKKIQFVSHHIAHSESAYLMSGFDQSLILVIDGRGDTGAGIIQSRHGNEVKLINTLPLEGSLGTFYISVIAYLGYEMFDEYKVMGLAPYGDPAKYRRYFKRFYKLLPEGQYIINHQYISLLFDLFPPRRKGEPFRQEHKDIAASLQESLETIVLHMLKYYREVTGHTKLCLAGGVAHNCSLNGKILYSGLFDDIFVQPAAHDAGCALGAALHLARAGANHQAKSLYPSKRLEHVYWGANFAGNDTISDTLNRWKNFIDFKILENTPREVARLLADGSVVGWVQGRSEFGPRALGNRSIVADPRPAENKDIINEMIKKREAYRPFAPSILEEDLTEYYEVPDNFFTKQFPFMNFVLKVNPDQQKILGAVTHIDGTARVQTVSKTTNPIYWELINEFKKITGIPIVLNTSFNNNAEPIVDSAQDALICFLTTKLNFLVIGDYLITKKSADYLHYLKMIPTLPLHVELSHSRQHISFTDVKDLYSMRVNYNENYNINISKNFHNLVCIIDGDRNLEKLMTYLGFDKNTQRECIDELLNLWALRLIKMNVQDI